VFTVDTHCHVSPGWYEPIEVLLFQMDRNGVDHAVMIQINGQFDNDYQLECVRQHPDRLSSVVLVDTADPAAPATLERLAEQGARGVRLRPDTRSPGDDPLAIWRKAADLGLAVSCGGSAPQFASAGFADVIQAVPTLPIVVEHLGSVNRPDGEPAPYALRQQVFALSRFPNVCIKVHGLGEFCRRVMPVASQPFDLTNLTILEQAVEAFGPERMMWGSDYPPVSGREGYANALSFTREQIAVRGARAEAAVFGGTAARVFGLVVG
jgi:L-fuconolactonase